VHGGHSSYLVHISFGLFLEKFLLLFLQGIKLLSANIEFKGFPRLLQCKRISIDYRHVHCTTDGLLYNMYIIHNLWKHINMQLLYMYKQCMYNNIIGNFLYGLIPRVY
jgi:hypothetical protein